MGQTDCRYLPRSLMKQVAEDTFTSSSCLFPGPYGFLEPYVEYRMPVHCSARCLLSRRRPFVVLQRYLLQRHWVAGGDKQQARVA